MWSLLKRWWRQFISMFLKHGKLVQTKHLPKPPLTDNRQQQEVIIVQTEGEQKKLSSEEIEEIANAVFARIAEHLSSNTQTLTKEETASKKVPALLADLDESILDLVDTTGIDASGVENNLKVNEEETEVGTAEAIDKLRQLKKAKGKTNV